MIPVGLNKAFSEFTRKRFWYKKIGLTQSHAAMLKMRFKNNELTNDKIRELLTKAGYKLVSEEMWGIREKKIQFGFETKIAAQIEAMLFSIESPRGSNKIKIRADEEVLFNGTKEEFVELMGFKLKQQIKTRKPVSIRDQFKGVTINDIQ